MSLSSLETSILAELQAVTKNPKLRKKHIMEWVCAEKVEVREGELTAYLPKLRIAVAYMLPEKKKASKPEAS